MSGELEKNSSSKLEKIQVNKHGVILKTMDDILAFSISIMNSDLSIKEKFKNADNVALAITTGLDVGLSPLQSLQSVAVIKGIPTIYGDAAKALVIQSGLCEKFEEYFEGEEYEDNFKAICITKRKGAEKEYKWTFSVADAKRAELWDKKDNWKKYPKRMLLFKARGYNLRDNFTDVLKGFKTTEEVEDYQILSSTVPENVYKKNYSNKKGLSGMMEGMSDDD